jgi:hypothetical protein
VGNFPGLADEGGNPNPAGPRERVGHLLPERGPRAGAGSSPNLPPPRSSSGPGLHDHSPETARSAALGDLRGLPVGRIPVEPQRSRGGSPRGSSVGKRLDRRSLADVVAETVRKVVAPFKAIMNKLAAAWVKPPETSRLIPELPPLTPSAQGPLTPMASTEFSAQWEEEPEAPLYNKSLQRLPAGWAPGETQTEAFRHRQAERERPVKAPEGPEEPSTTTFPKPKVRPKKR